MPEYSMPPERAYRLLLGLAGDLESQIQQTHPFAPDPLIVAGHLAMVARLLAEEIGRRLDEGPGHE